MWDYVTFWMAKALAEFVWFIVFLMIFAIVFFILDYKNYKARMKGKK